MGEICTSWLPCIPGESTDFRNWIGTWWFLAIIVDWLIWNPCLFFHPETWKPWLSLQDSVFWLLPRKRTATQKAKTAWNPNGRHPKTWPTLVVFQRFLPIFFQKSTAIFFRGLSNACGLKKCSGEDFFGSGDAKRRAVANEAQSEQNFLPLFNGHVFFFPMFFFELWLRVGKKIFGRGSTWWLGEVLGRFLLNFEFFNPKWTYLESQVPYFFMAIVAGFRGFQLYPRKGWNRIPGHAIFHPFIRGCDSLSKTLP